MSRIIANVHDQPYPKTDHLASTITPYVDSDPSGLTGWLAVQEVQQLLKKLQGEEEQLSSAKHSVRVLQTQLLAQSQTSHAAQQNATQLKVPSILSRVRA